MASDVFVFRCLCVMVLLLLQSYETSSSAFAERPHSALCLSVVSFSTVPRVQSFIMSYFGFRFTTAYS